MQNLPRLYLLVLPLLATNAACGSAMGTASDLASKDVVAKDGAGVLAQYRLVVGHFDSTSNAPECLALRTKVFANRQEVRGGSEWRTIVETAEYKQLDQMEEQFRSAHCSSTASTATQACSNLASTLEDKANSLAQTPQWQTLANNSHWHDLLTDFDNARQISCL